MSQEIAAPAVAAPQSAPADVLSAARRIVVKVGSSLVTNEGRGIDADAVGNWCRQLAALSQQGREVVMVSSGAIAEGMTNPIHLYFGVRSQEDLYDGDRLKALAVQYPNIKVHIVVATGPASSDLRAGLVTDAIESDFKSLDGWRAYLCGAPAMVEALSLIVAKLGMASEHVHADAFYPSGV